MNNQKQQLGNVIIEKLDFLLKKLALLEQAIYELSKNVNSSDDFLLEQIITPEVEVDYPPFKSKRKSTDRSLFFSQNESELSPASIRIYDQAEKMILINKPKFEKMVDYFNDGVKKKDIAMLMGGRPYHSYGAVCKMLRVGIRRGYIVTDGNKVTLTDKFKGK